MPKDSSQQQSSTPPTIVSEQILRKKVRQIVKEQDDEHQVSMKAVREKLEDDLGVSLSSQKDVLKKILQEEIDQKEEEEEEEKKRTHSEVAPSTSSDEPVTKKSKQETSAPKYVKADNGDYVIMFTGKKRITVNTYRRQKYVHIREYYEDKPTKKGIAMSQDEWDKFKEYIDTIDEMMRLA
ncbi:hypothetical protein FDP41_001688 [Naegleria fowleri]|uniref:DEK-C domain-containing protein n=1 Tax=Naegleria fowleri TaxID=5763 RepID=A0A6A5C1D0_NAEFO|nr:uncharacterized protein FDP41_001688 [Naegleria fowleri]KAF0979345.1 hypothetical protein FDP41_001688 [Naegleria fowleri]CAG4712910.1 unnamed protein product [Naegleria fowleri]